MALRCRLCGGELIANSDKTKLVCQICQTNYSKNEITALIQDRNNNLDIEDILKKANMFHKLQEYSKEKKLLDHAIAQYPNNWELWLALAKNKYPYGYEIGPRYQTSTINLTSEFEHAVELADEKGIIILKAIEEESIQKLHEALKEKYKKMRKDKYSDFHLARYDGIRGYEDRYGTEFQFIVENGELIIWGHVVGTQNNLFTKEYHVELTDEGYLQDKDSKRYVTTGTIDGKYMITLEDVPKSSDRVYFWQGELYALGQCFSKYASVISTKKNEDRRAVIETLKKSSKGACYIATAVYGDYEAPEVKVLRDFRDQVLMKTLIGRLFVKIYYKVSPPIANKLRKKKRVNQFVKKFLDMFVCYLEK